MKCDVWTSYAELNAELKENGIDLVLDNDTNAEDPWLIVGFRKWSYDGLPETGPEWPSELGFDLAEHVRVNDKYDVFIYTK